jgi:subtilisin family serine protease
LGAEYGTTTPQADTTEYVAGTSFSAPVVAGVASLVLAVAPQITAAQMRPDTSLFDVR